MDTPCSHSQPSGRRPAAHSISFCRAALLLTRMPRSLRGTAGSSLGQLAPRTMVAIVGLVSMCIFASARVTGLEGVSYLSYEPVPAAALHQPAPAHFHLPLRHTSPGVGVQLVHTDLSTQRGFHRFDFNLSLSGPGILPGSPLDASLAYETSWLVAADWEVPGLNSTVLSKPWATEVHGSAPMDRSIRGLQNETCGALPGGCTSANSWLAVRLAFRPAAAEPVVSFPGVWGWSGFRWVRNDAGASCAGVVVGHPVRMATGVFNHSTVAPLGVWPAAPGPASAVSVLVTVHCVSEGYVAPRGANHLLHRELGPVPVRLRGGGVLAPSLNGSTPAWYAFISPGTLEARGVTLLHPSNVQQYSVSEYFACALFGSNSSLLCWGANWNGQLGYGHDDAVSDTQPPFKAGLPRLPAGEVPVQVSAGSSDTCVVYASGRAQCWGWDSSDGILGHGLGNGWDETWQPYQMPFLQLMGNGTSTVQIEVSSNHACALLVSGQVQCWGAGSNGRLGYGTTFNTGRSQVLSALGPVSLNGSETAVSIAVMSAGSCVLMVEGKVRCWGSNYAGELGLGHTRLIGDDEPAGQEDFVSLSGMPVDLKCGQAHCCVLLADATMQCWGRGSSEQLGHGIYISSSTSQNVGDNELPSDVGPIRGMTGIAQISTAAYGTCAVFADGRYSCWGSRNYNSMGPTPYGISTTVAAGAYPSAEAPAPIVTLQASGSVTCFTTASQPLLCMGRNFEGNLGQGDTASNVAAPSATQPVQLVEGPEVEVVPLGYLPLLASPSTPHIRRLVLGGNFLCFEDFSADLRCRGSLYSGVAGLGGSVSPGWSEPLEAIHALRLPDSATAFATGYSHICMLFESASKLRCWGQNSRGIFGVGSDFPVWSYLGHSGRDPWDALRPLDFGEPIAQLASGNNHMCIILAHTRQLRCWGGNWDGQLGFGHDDDIGTDARVDNASLVQPVPIPWNATHVQAGDVHTCIISTNGTIHCWGDGRDGKLGTPHRSWDIGDTEAVNALSAPALNMSGSPVALSLSNSHSCALLAEGSVQCWGAGDNGRLGYGDTSDIGRYDTPGFRGPVPLPAGEVVAKVCTLNSATCVLLTEGSVRCWGAASNGQLGLGTSESLGDDELPGTAPKLTFDRAVLDLACSPSSVCVLLAGGMSSCWGYNPNDMFGYNTDNNVVGASLTYSDYAPTGPSFVLRTWLADIREDDMATAIWLGPANAAATAPVGRFELRTEARGMRTTSSAASIPPWLWDSMTGAHRTNVAGIDGDLFSVCAVSGLPTVQGAPREGAFASVQRTVCLWPSDWYLPPIVAVSAVSPIGIPKLPTTGGASVALTGRFWALLMFSSWHVSHISIGQGNCSEPVVQGTRMSCVAPALTEVANASSLTVSLSYFSDGTLIQATAAEPLAYSVPSVVSAMPERAATTLALGGGELLLSGQNLGPTFLREDSHSLPLSMVSVSVWNATVGGSLVGHCDVSEFWSTGLVCMMPPRGHFTQVYFEVHLAGQGSGQPRLASVSYDSPALTTVSPTQLLARPPGGPPPLTTLNFTGSGLFVGRLGAPAGGLGQVSVQVAGLECGSVIVRSPSELTCADLPLPLSSPLLLGSDAFVTVLHGAFAVTSRGLQLEVLPPATVSGVQPPIVSAAGGAEIAILGSALETVEGGSPPQVMIGGAACQLLSHSATQVRCLVPSAAASGFSGRAPLALALRSGLMVEYPNGILFSSPELLSVSNASIVAGQPGFPAPRASMGFTGLDLIDGNGSSTFFIAGLSCTALGGRLSLDPSGRQGRCSDFDTALLPSATPGEIFQANASLLTASGLEAQLPAGAVRVLGPPTLSRASPATGYEGDIITLSGQNLGVSSADILNVSVGSVLVNRWTRLSSTALTIELPAPASETLADLLNLPLAVQLTSGWVAQAPAEQSLNMLLPARPPRTAPTQVCPYREADGAARVVFVWRDDAVTLVSPVTSWQVHFGSKGIGSSSHNSTLRVVTVESSAPGDIIAPALTTACRYAAEDALYTVDIRLLDVPVTPLWVQVSAGVADGNGVTLAGPRSPPAGPLFTVCSREQYLATQFAYEGEWDRAVCAPCPEGAVCNGLAWDHMTNAEGYFRVPWSTHGLLFEKCPLPSSCPSKLITAPSTPSNFSAMPNVPLHCKEGHAGPLCVKCDIGYGSVGAGDCDVCGETGSAAGVMIAMVCLLSAAALWVVRGQLRTRGSQKKDHSVVKKVLLNHLQQISLMLAFNLDWPNPLSAILGLTDAVTSGVGQLASPDCLREQETANSAGSAFRLRVISSIALPAMLVCLSACVALIRMWAGKSSPTDVRRQLIVMSLVLGFIFYTPLTRTTMQLFSCTRVGGQLRLVEDTDVLCDSPGNQAWALGVGLPLLLLYVIGLPAIIGGLLWRNRQRLSEVSVRRTYGFFFLGYKPEFYWYELWIMARKAIFALLLVALSPAGLLWQLTAAISIVLVALVVSAWLRPFRLEVFNALDVCSMVLALATLTGGTALVQFAPQFVEVTSQYNGGKPAQYAVTVVLTILNSAFLVYVVLWWARALYVGEVKPAMARTSESRQKLAAMGKASIMRIIGTSSRGGGFEGDLTDVNGRRVSTVTRRQTKWSTNPLKSTKSLSQGASGSVLPASSVRASLTRQSSVTSTGNRRGLGATIATFDEDFASVAPGTRTSVRKGGVSRVRLGKARSTGSHSTDSKATPR